MIASILDALDIFHFLRPWWLAGLPGVAVLWWLVRNRDVRQAERPVGLAPHLAEALTVGEQTSARWQPIDSSALAMCLLLLAAAGPTWSRVPNPFLSQKAPVVVVLEVTPSMDTPDLQPSRLERAKFKVLDLIERRVGARTGVIAYAGSAHRLAPLTEDPEVLRVMLQALDSKVMPANGTDLQAALELAHGELAKSATPGTLLLITDGVDSTDLPALASSAGEAPVIVLFAAPEDEPLGALANDEIALLVRLSANESDIDMIERAVNSAFRAALLEDDRLDWEDRGWILAWPAALLLALWFRQGWTMRWALVLLCLGAGMSGPRPALAGTIDWFLTPDQQGMLKYRQKDFATASTLFQDPHWRAYVLMRNGKYAEAADIFSRIETPEAAFAEGYARIRNREYRPAIEAYERALALQPDFPEAQQNLEVSQAILDFVEVAREQGDTGEEAGIGADDIVYDNQAQRGVDTTQDYGEEERPTFTTAEQWMRAVDTNMSDFLRSRFRLELQARKE